jgi:hypothetical protein
VNSVLTEQQRRNLESRESWNRYAPHRDRVMQLLSCEGLPREPRACLLGAGNCNDVDLSVLVGEFAEVHLVDLDSQALEFAVSSQGIATGPPIFCHGGIDVSGMADELASLRDLGPAGGSRAVERALGARLPLGDQRFELVASLCLLTQMVDSIRLTLTEQHPSFLDVVAAVRLRHLRIMAETLRGGGRLTFVSDIVSSLTFPKLPEVPPAELSRVVTQLVRERNFFTGLNPLVLHQLFHTDEVLSQVLQDVELVPPWLWNFGPRVYAVYAITARKRP